jgi:hypothetical protein
MEAGKLDLLMDINPDLSVCGIASKLSRIRTAHCFVNACILHLGASILHLEQLATICDYDYYCHVFIQ